MFILIGVLIGVLTYWIASLVLAQWIAVIIGLFAALVYIFGDRHYRRLR